MKAESIFTDSTIKRLAVGLAVAVCIIGIGMRLYRIAAPEFFFYDEGLYLNQSRALGEAIASHPPKTMAALGDALKTWARFCLSSGKALWSFIIDVRFFFGGIDAWHMARVFSAMFGIGTLALIFIFARRFFESRLTAWLAMVFLAVLPSHVLYSRLALQEAASTFFFLLGFYLYLFPKKFGARTFLSSVSLACVFFTNYRLIIAPALVLLYEVYAAVAAGTKIDFRKYVWHTLTFLFLVFVIGNLDNARNATITFAWMFHQAQLAEGQSISLLNFLSYPYYLFHLESALFAVFFFAGFYYAVKRQCLKLFPFLMGLAAMAAFSFAAAQSARYISVVLPFITMAAAYAAACLFEQQKSLWARVIVAVAIALTTVSMCVKSFAIATARSDYKNAAIYLKTMDPDPKIVSTQHLVQNLYADRRAVIQCPWQYGEFFQLYRQGYRYLIIGPQAYISWTENQIRCRPPLIGYLRFIQANVAPVKIFAHCNDAMLERFAFEHSTDLRTTRAFVRQNHDAARKFGALYVYDMRDCYNAISRALSSQQK